MALDADTLFPPDTLAKLARWFADPRVGAVAGNALVGNRSNLITRWQALEYVTAQNLERRALAALGAVTVVPGAVGAWRRSALEALGGYPADTLAEDQDLTLAVQRAGWRVEFDPDARAYTEAPETVARPPEAALPLVVRHAAVHLEAPRGAVRPQAPGAGLHRPAADLAVPDRADGDRAAGRPGDRLEPDLARSTAGPATRRNGRRTT